MNEAKKQVLQEIEKRIVKHKEAAARAINNKTVDSLVIAFIKNVEDINEMKLDTGAWVILKNNAQETLWHQLQSFDHGCKISVSWSDENSDSPQVHCVTIKWSEKYQQENNCDPELNIDITAMFI